MKQIRIKNRTFLKSPIKDPRSEKYSHQKKELPQTTDGHESGQKKTRRLQESMAKLVRRPHVDSAGGQVEGEAHGGKAEVPAYMEERPGERQRNNRWRKHGREFSRFDEKPWGFRE